MTKLFLLGQTIVQSKGSSNCMLFLSVDIPNKNKQKQRRCASHSSVPVHEHINSPLRSPESLSTINLGLVDFLCFPSCLNICA